MSEASAVSTESAADAYTRLYEQEHPRLVAYARTLMANRWLAEDLVAEAHFRVWRRIQGGHQIDNVPAYLRTTIRHLATTVGAAASREIPQDPEGEQAWPETGAAAETSDPAQRVAYVDLLARVMDQLPQRWVKALWLAEAEDQPLEAVGRAIGAGKGATAVLLHRAREGMRQAFLRAVPGTPGNPSCEAHWERMPALVRGEATAKQADGLSGHVADCPDCRARMALLTRANHRLPALTGPALLVLLAGGSAKFLVPLVGAGAGAAAAGSAPTPGAGALKSVRHLLRGQIGQAGPLAATVAGVGLAAVATAAVAAGFALTSDQRPLPPQRAASAPTDTTPEDAARPAPATPPTATPAPPADPPSPPSPSAPPTPPPSQAPVVPPAPATPSPTPTTAPTRPTTNPTTRPTPTPTPPPTPTTKPTPPPSPTPTPPPTTDPTVGPTPDPTVPPTPDPTVRPTPPPTVPPTPHPTTDPTKPPKPPEVNCRWEQWWGWLPVWVCSKS